MEASVKTVIENSKREAEKLVSLTAEVRKAYAVGRPNSSRESTAEGALEVFSILVANFNPGYAAEQ